MLTLPWARRITQMQYFSLALGYTCRTSEDFPLRCQAIYACNCETRRGFFEGVCASSNATANLHDPPPTPRFANSAGQMSPHPQQIDDHCEAHRKPDQTPSKR